MEPHWDGAAIDHLSEYLDVNGNRMRFDALNMYIGDLTLSDGSQTTNVSRIELFRFIQNLIDNTREREYQLTPGNYDNVNFGIGVPMDLNNIAPGRLGCDDGGAAFRERYAPKILELFSAMLSGDRDDPAWLDITPTRETFKGRFAKIPKAKPVQSRPRFDGQLGDTPTENENLPGNFERAIVLIRTCPVKLQSAVS